MNFFFIVAITATLVALTCHACSRNIRALRWFDARLEAMEDHWELAMIVAASVAGISFGICFAMWWLQ